uniref:Pheromone n=1 Tax=Peronospora matthiolae TaxID=2874970 RepID=A0AAV1TAL0_9STRA
MADVMDDIPPAFDDESDAGNHTIMADASGCDGEPHSGDFSDSDSSHSGAMDDVESAITADHTPIWPAGEAPNFRYKLST